MVTLMWNQVLFSVILLSLLCGRSNGATVKATGSDGKTEKLLETSNSEKQEVKLEHKLLSASDEKLGTSATIPIGYATSNGIIYDAPLTSGSYGGFGTHPGSFVAPHHQHGAEHFHGHGGQILNQGGYGLHQGGAHGIVPNHGHHGGHHGGELVGGYGPGGHVGGYQGVVYAGHGPHGQPHLPPYSQGHVNINKQSQVAVGPYGDVHQAIQKTVSQVEPGHGLGHGGPVPYSPYGHGGVVYMGNGLIPEHIAGVKQVGPVLPPPGYRQHENVVIKQGTAVGPFGNVHSGLAVKSTVDSVGLGGVHGGFGGYSDGPFHQGNFHHHDGLGHGGIYPQHQQVSIDKVSGVGVDPYGNIMKDVAIRKQIQTGPGLGYNGIANHAIAHTDQAILGPHHHRPHHQHYDYSGGFGNPDPYFNNLIDPIYRTGGVGHSASLLTTGPHRYYQGKNPIGVYERHHRLG